MNGNPSVDAPPEPSGLAEAALLADVLHAMPFGIAVRGADGGVAFQNGPAAAYAEATAELDELQHDGRTLRLSSHGLTSGGRRFEVRLGLDVTEQRRTEDELFRRAYLDELTGLPNRTLMQQTVERLTAEPAAGFALAFIDLDGFKHINDYYGHSVGDGLLVKIAQRLIAEIGPADMLARIGGDEFVLLMTALGPEGAVALELERLSQRLKEPFFVEGHEIFASASIGVSLFPRDGASYDVLRTNADCAMYRMKSGSKGGVRFFDPTVGHAATERSKVEQRLRLAIRDRRLCCAFQPKVDFRTQRVVGVEVLLRLRDEQGIIQAPGDFVNLAVELGLMDEITHLVLADTIRSLDAIDGAFGGDVTVSLNVAARQAGDPAFMRALLERIAATGQPERFVLELTEEAFLSKDRFQRDVLPMIRQIGAKVSIDDFGVGYSSLAALADITADELKVDRSFITAIHQRPRSQGILKAIESLAHALGMAIVVEGVESFEELAYLQAATRIRCGQGFYFARPMFLDQLPRQQVAATLARAGAPARAPAAARPAAQRAAGGR